MRLDKYLVEHKLVTSRNKAQDLISRGYVLVNDEIKLHVDYQVQEIDKINIVQHEQYVSRGAYKLIEGINRFKINLKDKVVLDIGSSTGGFTQVCLINGAKKIYAIDVGTNQMDKKLSANKRIELYEQTNFKDVTPSIFKERVELIVADLSFISITKILDKISELFDYSFEMVLLIKPQYELGKDIIKAYKGVIKSQRLWDKAIDIVSQHAKSLKFKIKSIIPSPIKGSKGNTEFLMYLTK